MISNPVLFWCAVTALGALLLGFILGHLEGKRFARQARDLRELTSHYRNTIGV